MAFKRSAKRKSAASRSGARSSGSGFRGKRRASRAGNSGSMRGVHTVRLVLEQPGTSAASRPVQIDLPLGGGKPTKSKF